MADTPRGPDSPGVPPEEGVYLDHAAATPLDDGVAAAMEAARRTGFANPSSPHAPGRLARRLLEESRERILAALGCAADRFVFTGGATEANRLAILGLAAAAAGPGWCGVSARDHSSAQAAAAELAGRGWRVEGLPLRADATLAAPPPVAMPAILSTTLVCGQTGTVEDLGRLADWMAGPGRLVHVDATQAVVCGPGPESAARAGAATVSLAPHKFGGPRGIGGLLVRCGVELRPVVPGPQERGLRGGTEAVALAVGFAHALERATAARRTIAAELESLRLRFEADVLAAAAAAGIEAVVVAAAAPRAAHISTIAFPGLEREAVVMAADLEGVAAATGTACASGASEPAPALVAMGLPDDVVRSAVRFSLGRETTSADIHAAVGRLAPVLRRMASADRWKSPTLHAPRHHG